ncbi:MAG: serine hydrolase [Bacteroidales bacterium]|nr:serine hydrolase [Bacteroidales bacterium]
MRIVAIPLFIMLTSAAHAQERSKYMIPLKVIDAWLDAQRDYSNIPGISAGFVVDQELVWCEGYGYADLELKIPATENTLYSICSISKLFTSIAVMQLRDLGKIGLDDDILKHLPWLDLEQVFPNSDAITIRSLLTHSSGVPRDADYFYWSDKSFPFPTVKQVKEGFSEQRTIFPASSDYEYSNLGMTILGILVSEISGISYEEYVIKNILEPLELNDTRPEMPEQFYKDRLATGYSVISREGGRDEFDFFQADGITPAAGFSSSVNDLAKFASWQFRIREEIEDPVLNGNTLKEMQRVHWLSLPGWDLARGLGFGIYKTKGTTLVGHSGKCPGYLTQFKMDNLNKWAFIVMINCLGDDSYRFVEGMYNILSSYDKSESMELPSDIRLEDYEGKYYDFWDGESLVIPWKGKLAVFSLKAKNQDGLPLILKHTEKDTFRILPNDSGRGNNVWFERDDTGKVIRYHIHSFYMEKMD